MLGKSGIGLSAPDIAGVAAAGGVALQPIGATEQHGPHLPVDTDATVAAALARMTAERLPANLPAWVLPVLAYSKSAEHTGLPGTVTLLTTTTFAVCMDVARSVAASGFRTLVFVNAHGGNPELLHVVTRDIRAELGLHAYWVHAPTLPLPEALAAQVPALDVHAGFSETSMMLALDPGAVDLTAAVPGGQEKAAEIDLLQHVSMFGTVPLPWHTKDLSASGVIGDPAGANAEWGRAALDALATTLAETVVELASLTPADGVLA